MKKIILTAIFAAVVLVSANAQQFGVKGGLNVASISGIHANEWHNEAGRTSLHFGVMAEFKIFDKFSIQPELLYSGQGVTYEKIDINDWEKEKVQLNYINIPVMAKYYVAEGFSLEAGPQIGFLTSAKSDNEEFEYGPPEVLDIKTTDIKQFLNSTDFGLNFGAGYKLDSGLNFGVRYNVGLSNINKITSADVPHSVFKISDVNNSVFQISVGYFFN